jgi:hypothetical protein
MIIINFGLFIEYSRRRGRVELVFQVVMRPINQLTVDRVQMNIIGVDLMAVTLARAGLQLRQRQLDMQVIIAGIDLQYLESRVMRVVEVNDGREA